MTSAIRFGTDGWRAVIAEDFTFENVRLCAQSVADYVKTLGSGDGPVVVGYDTRFHSENFAAATAEVLAANGIVARLADKPAPTQAISYSIVHQGAKAGVVITASHNPGVYNGFKFRADYGGAASPQITAFLEGNIRTIQEKGLPVRRMDLEEARRKGLVQDFDPVPDYVAKLKRMVDIPPIREAGLSVVVDAMHGTGAGYLVHLVDGGKTLVEQIRGERNPAFPHMRGPEPIAENLEPLIAAVGERKADLGLANDCDADRVGVVDEKGNYINQLEVYGLLFLYLLEVRGLRGPAVKTLTSSQMINRLGKLYGVPVYETAVGFKFVGPKMLEVDALIGGEESGGFAFRGHIPERDGILAGLFLMDMMAQTGKTASQLVSYLHEKAGPSYYDRIDLRFPASRREAILEGLKTEPPVELNRIPVVEVGTEDGFKYFLEDGSWVLIRFSGTEPILRIYTETDSQDKVAPLLEAGRELTGV